MVSEAAGLGRYPSWDKRNEQYKLVRPAVAPDVRRKMWHGSKVLDQLATPRCVGYATEHWLTAGPVTNPSPEMSADDWYAAAQELDEWPGTNYDGSSILGAAKALKQRGYIDRYEWAMTVDDIFAWVLARGPMMVGTMWTLDMFTPDEDDFIEPTGEVVGGHAYVLIGADLDKKCYDESVGALRMLNSWGRGWSDNGRAWISRAAMVHLLQEYGEAVTAPEIRVRKATP